MKKILLCGATHGSNFGDSLFALMFKKNIESKYNDVEVVFTRASEHSKNELDIRAATFKDLFEADALIYISGGYFGESHNESFMGSIRRFLMYYKYGLLMHARKKPIAILGVGAGPFTRTFLKKIAVYIFNKAKVVSVRDETSREYMHSYGVTKEIIVSSDSAQVIDNKILNNKFELSLLNDTRLKKRKNILVHITSAAGENLYYEYVIKAIRETLCLDNTYGYIVTSDCVIDHKYLDKVYKKLPKDRTIVYKYQNPLEFLKLIDRVDAVITPKLHVGILGCTFGKPVLSFPIHPGKTERYYHQIGYPEHCKSLYKLSKDDAKDMINEYVREKVKLPKHIKDKAQLNFELLHEFIEDYVSKH